MQLKSAAATTTMVDSMKVATKVGLRDFSNFVGCTFLTHFAIFPAPGGSVNEQGNGAIESHGKLERI